jgi:hypothetical protein
VCVKYGSVSGRDGEPCPCDDCDLRKPVIIGILKKTLLQGKQSLAIALGRIISTEGPRMQVMVADAIPPNPVEMWVSTNEEPDDDSISI